jgi:hypothetical protein
MKGNEIMRMAKAQKSLSPNPATMGRSGFRYGALCVIGAAAFLTACSLTSSSLGPPTLASLRQPATTQSNLLYIGARHKVRVLEFPDGHSVSDLRLQFGILGGLCSDPSGDVYFDVGQWTYEYPHGGTHSIASVLSPFGFPLQCAFDATTGNLAVITGGSNEQIAVYEHFTGRAHEYPVKEYHNLNDCGYDGSGDLFVTTPWALAELPKGARNFTTYTPRLKSADSELTRIQWDGTYLVVQETQPSKPFTFLDRIAISHKHVKLVSRTKLIGSDVAFESLFSSTAIGLYGPAHNEIGFWNYPAGGKPSKLLSRFDTALYAATVSAASSR